MIQASGLPPTPPPATLGCGDTATSTAEPGKDRLLQRLQRRIAQFGYNVSLEPLDAVAA